MKKKNLSKLKSLINFKNEVEETHTLIHTLETQIIGTQELLNFTKIKDRPEYDKFKKFFEISKNQEKKLHKLGFIAFFANFECFMFESLKELFKRYPNSFSSEKVAKFEDIKDFKKVTEVISYFIDSLAIQKSYDIETWVNFMADRFGIAVFASKKDLIRFKMLSSLRNLILHSGSKTNSKFRNDMKNILKSSVPIGKSIHFDMKKYFAVLYNGLCILIKRMESY